MRAMVLGCVVMIAMAGCSSVRAVSGPEGSDAGRSFRSETPRGEAAIALELEERTVRVGARLSLRLVNTGEVQLLTGLPFVVERWDGAAWAAVPLPENTVWPMVGIILPPGGRTDAQYWPYEATRTPEPGRYRVIKHATYEDPQHREPDRELTAIARFTVTD